MKYSIARFEMDALDKGPCADDSISTQDEITAQESAEAEDYEMDKWMKDTADEY